MGHETPLSTTQTRFGKQEVTGLEPQVPVDAMSEMIVHTNACGDNSGLIILGNCEDQDILLLVDTGAGISLMSRGCFIALGSK